MIASSVNYSNDLSDGLSAKNARICTSSESDNIRIPIQNVVLYESISRIDHEVITLRGEYVQESDSLNNSVKGLAVSNEKLRDLVNKQSNKMFDLQTQINLIRDSQIQKELDQVVKRCCELETRLNDQNMLSASVDKLEKVICELSETVKRTHESSESNSTEIKKLKANLSDLQNKMKSESSRINMIQDKRYAGVSSL